MYVVSIKILVIIILFASIFNTAYLLDLAIMYAILSFIGLIFITHFMMERIKGRGPR